jgi:hypothetical protein
MTNDAERVSDIVAGWKLVPMQPTQEMIDAGLKRNGQNPHPWCPAVYRAMLTASPKIEAADIIEAQSKALAEARVVKPLEWGSEPPYLVARTRQGAHYSIEVMRDEDGNNPLIWTGGSFGSTTGKYLTVEAAKAAAQADHQQRILSALATPTPENPNG